ncbi:DUF6868 family protein [Hohaiivirga grylli]|uniref:DUF6868 family protein n=1 Tax=Hohaiivirga grylli TaxID=3133970 RepID=UPI00387E3F35
MINLAIVTLYFLIFVSMHDALFRLHSRWFRLSRGAFDLVLYSCLAFYKIATLLLFVVPYLVMKFGF